MDFYDVDPDEMEDAAPPVPTAPAGRPAGGTLAERVTTVGEANKALALCVLLGWAGAHRAYARMWGSFLLYLLTAGLLCVGWFRDIFVLARRRSELRRASAPAFPSPTEYDRDEAERRRREDEERQAELQRQNRDFLEAYGIDVDMFGPEKVVADALRTIGEVCPCMLRFDHGLRREEPLVIYSSPTRSGKLPKNVVEARVRHEVVTTVRDAQGYEWPRHGDSIGVRISYLADGRINKFEVHGHHRDKSVSASIRRRGDELVLTSAGTVTLATGAWQSLCPGPDPTPAELLEALDREVERIY